MYLDRSGVKSSIISIAKTSGELPFKLLKLFVFFAFLTLLSSLITLPTQASTIASQDYSAYLSSKHSSTNWDSLVKSGMEAFHSGDYDIAQKSLYKAFNKGCKSPILIFMLALISEYNQAYYSSLDYYQMAKKGFKSSNKGHRYHKSFNENYGRAMYYSGKKDEAMPFLKKAGKRSKSFWLLKLLGMLSYEKGDTLNAVSYLERAVRVRSDDVTKQELVYIYSLLAKLFLYKGEKDGAHRYYQKVAELDPNHPEAKQYMQRIEKTYRDQKVNKMLEFLKD